MWNQNELEVKFNDKYSGGVKEKIQYLPAMGDISVKFGEIYAKRSVTGWFELGLAQRVQYFKQVQGWFQENRTMVLGNFSAGLGGMNFDFSNRLEYRMIENNDNHFRYRQMLSLNLPPFQVPWFVLFVSEEVFYQFSSAKLHLARVYTGTEIRYHKTLSSKFYYALEKSNKLAYWNTSDVLGVNVKFDF
jgi:hypothetical protein